MPRSLQWFPELPGNARHAHAISLSKSEEQAFELALAQLHVAAGMVEVEKQRRVINRLERDGHDTAMAEAFLTILLNTQVLREQRRDTVKHEVEVPPQA